MSRRALPMVAWLLLSLALAACQPAVVPTLVAPAATPVPPLTTPVAIAATTAPEPVVEVLAATTPATAVVNVAAGTPAGDVPRKHVVAEGDTISALSNLYGVPAAAIVAANGLADENAIEVGTALLIPAAQAAATAPSAAPLATTVPLTVSLQTRPADWPPSRTDADPENYPLLRLSPAGGLRIHYQPGTFPEATMETLAPALDDILFHLQQQMGAFLDRPVDIYLAGTLFADTPSLQGLSVSRQYRTTVLVNGAYHQGEEYYILGHELTHVAATNLFGPASSTMIHEGLATYLPQNHLRDAGYLSIHEIAAVAQQAGAFVPASTLIQYTYERNEFNGHIRSFLNYNLAGSFTGYLIERFGMERMAILYSSGNYYNAYGASLAQLDSDWQEWLSGVEVPGNAQDYTTMLAEVTSAYRRYMLASSDGYHANYLAYLALNRARLANNRGLPEQARVELDEFWRLFGP